ncbi:PREDICTED: DNA polymerase subunit gamma-2, mitochondrial-like isoform X2 [Priapulus caudatus]|uniref:DNA polymerase subunit gamma-2, mitochondrial-like isoform X2 n=1 Tax=Priapulus caudatus TaxID=37621 RepID=A0ABM1EVT5_PRICU|nr:PREDICTED: DNA polymerase subunit gamma-2, mitochondrial-like isoform X2 [Priapulus caudatus]
MAEVNKNLMQGLIKLCHRLGFFYPVESNGKFSSCYRYGPFGAEFRRNILHEWWTAVSLGKTDIYAVEDLYLEEPVEQDGSRCHVTSDFHTDRSSRQLCHYLPTLSLVGGRLPFGIAQCWTHRHGNEVMAAGRNKFFQKYDINAYPIGGVSQQLLLQYFSGAGEVTDVFTRWQRRRMLWYRKFAGTPSNFTLSEVQQSESKVTDVTISFRIPWEGQEAEEAIEVISARGDADLKALELRSGQSCQGKDGRRSVLPHLVECSSSLERVMLAYLVDAYHLKERTDTKGCISSKEVLRLHPRLAPYKVAIVTGAGQELRDLTDYLAVEFANARLRMWYIQGTATVGSHESQYTRFDEMGIPYSISVNENTVKTGVCLLRNRDTTLKQQVHITELVKYVAKLVQAY